MNNLLSTYVDYTRISLKLIFVHRANANGRLIIFCFVQVCCVLPVVPGRRDEGHNQITIRVTRG